MVTANVSLLSNIIIVLTSQLPNSNSLVIIKSVLATGYEN